MKEESNYFAFISYKSEDGEWATWLQHELMHYHLPASFNGRKNVRKNLRPIFRDIDELSAGNLSEQIHHALKNSQNLIVICSPKSAQSEWVNDEVKTFISLGRTDRIFPFIVEGNKPDDFFPPALLALPKNKERLGGDVRKNGKDAAFVKVVAGMLGLRFSALWNKYEIEKAEELRKVREQRDNLFKFQSRFLSEMAETEIANENTFLARRLALAALPKSVDADDRPYVAEAENALRGAYLEDCFKTSVPLQDASQAKVVSSRYCKEIVLFSPGELFVIDSTDGRIILNLISPKNKHFDYERDLIQENAFFKTATISPDGELLATVHSDNICRIWKLKSGECLGKIQAVFDYEEFEKVFPDFDPYDEDNRDQIGMDTVAQQIDWACFSHDGKTLAISSYNCTLWDVGTLKKVKSLYHPQPFIGEIDLSPDGKYVTGTKGFWDVETGVFTSYPIKEQEGNGAHCRFSQDGKSVGIILSPYVYVVDFESLSVIHKVKSRNYSLENSAFSPDLAYFYFKEKGNIYLRDNTSKKIFKLYGGNNDCFCIEEQSNGLVIYTAGEIVFRSPASPVEALDYPLLEDNKHLHTAAFHYPLVAYTYVEDVDDDYVLNDDEETWIAIYDISVGKVICILEGLKYRTLEAAFSYDMQYLTAYDNEFLIWRIPGENPSMEPLRVDPINRLPLKYGDITAMIPLTDGRGIVYASEFVLALNDGKDFILLESAADNDFATPTGWNKGTDGDHFWREGVWDEKGNYYATALAISPDENHLIVGYNDSYLRIWDIQTRKIIKRIYLNAKTVHSLAFSPDGRYVLVHYTNGVIAVLNALEDYQQILMADIHRLNTSIIPHKCSFDASDSRIAFLFSRADGQDDDNLYVGALDFPPLDLLLNRAREQFQDVAFSDEEKKRYLLD